MRNRDTPKAGSRRLQSTERRVTLLPMSEAVERQLPVDREGRRSLEGVTFRGPGARRLRFVKAYWARRWHRR